MVKFSNSSVFDIYKRERERERERSRLHEIYQLRSVSFAGRRVSKISKTRHGSNRYREFSHEQPGTAEPLTRDSTTRQVIIACRSRAALSWNRGCSIRPLNYHLAIYIWLTYYIYSGIINPIGPDRSRRFHVKTEEKEEGRRARNENETSARDAKLDSFKEIGRLPRLRGS